MKLPRSDPDLLRRRFLDFVETFYLCLFPVMLDSLINADGDIEVFLWPFQLSSLENLIDAPLVSAPLSLETFTVTPLAGP